MDRQLLNRATDGTDAPTPGYLYVDIAKNASSSPVACTEIATFLTRKLANKQNANIKWKCLKVITKTALTVQRGQFKRAVAQDHTAVAAIRQCTNFRGPPDPVRGDEPYNRVRIAAKECLDVIYSDTPTTDQASPYSSGVGGGGGGMSNTYGASPHAMQQQQQQDYSHGYGGGPSHGGGGGGGPRRMEGIGNPMFKDPRLDPQPENNIQGILREVGDVALNMIKDPLARNVEVQPRSVGRPGGGYGAPTPGNPVCYVLCILLRSTCNLHMWLMMMLMMGAELFTRHCAGIFYSCLFLKLSFFIIVLGSTDALHRVAMIWHKRLEENGPWRPIEDLML